MNSRGNSTDGSQIGALAKALLEGLVSTATDARRLTRGRAYVRDGAVLDVDVSAGVVRGSVLGSERTPYRVALHAPPSAWALGGVDEATLDPAALKRLIPEYYRIRWTCTCPDGAEACKHAVAVALSFAQRVAVDPGLLVLWRSSAEVAAAGRPRVVAEAGRDAAGDTADGNRLPTATEVGGGVPGPHLRLVPNTGPGHARAARIVPRPPEQEPVREPISGEMRAFLGLAAAPLDLQFDLAPIELARPHVGAVDLGEFVLDAQLMIRAALRPIR